MIELVVIYLIGGIINVTAKHLGAKEWAPVTRQNWWKSFLFFPVEWWNVMWGNAPY